MQHDPPIFTGRLQSCTAQLGRMGRFSHALLLHQDSREVKQRARQLPPNLKKIIERGAPNGNVLNWRSMRAKLTLLAGLALGCLISFAQAGGKICIPTSTGARWCPSISAASRPAPACARAIYRTYPTLAGTFQPAFYNWGPSVVVCATDTGFSNLSVSSVGGTPVYRLPPPVFPSPPLVVDSQNTFSWKH